MGNASRKSNDEKFDLRDDGGAGNALSASYFSPSKTVTRKFFFNPTWYKKLGISLIDVSE